MKNTYLDLLKLIIKIAFIAFVCIRIRFFLDPFIRMIFYSSYDELYSGFWFENILDFAIIFAFWFWTRNLLVISDNNSANIEANNRKSSKYIFNRNRKSKNK